MKIIYIANIRIPTEKAHGIQIVKMCEAFADLKAQVELIIPRRFNRIKEDPFDYYGIKRNFKIKKLFCLDLIPLDKYIGHLGFWIESATFYFFTFFHLFFKKVDIIYTRDKLFLFYALFFKNLIYEAHGFPKKYFLSHLFFKRLKRIVVITQKLRDLFIEQGIPENKILVAPSGVELRDFDIEDDKEKYRRELNLPENKIIIGYVGRLETMAKEKGIDILIKAFKILKEENEDILLCIVGGPIERIKGYQDLAKKIGLKEKEIIFTGQIRQKLIPKYLKSFDFLTMPYPWTEHYAFYMSPLKLFEYMASKRPIVASDLPSIREILNENNSLLVEPDNPKRLAEGIKNVLGNSNFSAKISNQAFQDVQNYTWQKRAGKILEFIK